MKKIAIIAACTGIAVALGWRLWPTLVVGSLVFADRTGEESGRTACDRIVGVGPRAIPAIIASLKRNSPWSRRYCYLPVALRELGAPARAALLRAIDSESDALTRAKLVASLQDGFGDYSRLTVVLDDALAGRIGSYPIHMIDSSLRVAFTNAPALRTGSMDSITVSTEFVEWWKEHSEQQGGGYSPPAARSAQPTP